MYVPPLHLDDTEGVSIRTFAKTVNEVIWLAF